MEEHPHTHMHSEHEHEYDHGYGHDHGHEHGHDHHHPAGTEHASILSGSCRFLLSRPVPLSEIASAVSGICSRLSLSPSLPCGGEGEPLPGHLKVILATGEGARCAFSSTIRGETNSSPLAGWDPDASTSEFRTVIDIILLTEEHPEPEAFFSLLEQQLPVSGSFPGESRTEEP